MINLNYKNMEMVTINDFNGRLNLSNFTNLQKGISQVEFAEQYLKGDKYEIYTERQVVEFYKSINEGLQKGITDVDGLKIANKELSTLQQVKLTKGDEGEYISVYVREKQISNDKEADNLEKGGKGSGRKKELEKEAQKHYVKVDHNNKTKEQNDKHIAEGDKYQKMADQIDDKDDMKKGVVVDSFGTYNNNKLSFTKSGKEIKKQISDVVLPVLNAQKAALSAQLLLVVDNCGENVPDQILSSYYYKGFSGVLPKMMIYDYRICEQPYDNNTNSRPEMTDEMKACRQYNELIYQIVSTSADIEYCGMLSRNLKDETKFELTPDQILGLQF